ncbi:MAG: hypothetical protein A2Z16_02125 [Chloroflexi bacterium RBG_16_54_18]|nr:MAG: hypothetical protein A2Z16_02125 [Chloroflexi bacterium RBG_16_54_18]
MTEGIPGAFRKTSQILAPANAPVPSGSRYNLYPAFSIPGSQIYSGFRGIASLLAGQQRVVIDGYAGVMWELFRASLDREFIELGMQASFQHVAQAYKNQALIEKMIAPSLGGDDPLFGSRFPGELADFFDSEKLSQIHPDEDKKLNVLYGCGAVLAGWDGVLVYVDVPKNEIQFRMRAGNIQLLGVTPPAEHKSAYKHLYFVDWPVLNRHKSRLVEKLELYIDAQRPAEPLVISGDDLRSALTELSFSAFRARPWFEPGPWGGQWIQENVPQLPRDVPNYAWSFELISPENGILLESGGRLLEVSFDMLMYYRYQAVLGDFEGYFRCEFPIRFDFLDTFDGSNLSIQCHPRTRYIREHFGENITQDEAYYVLDCKPGAKIYLGFQKSIDPQAFRQQLELSARENIPVEIDRYVNSIPANRHDLVLIPAGTIHGSGKDNLILEISATPYIFTFKMYDWLRLDLDGKPRPLNIERAFENLVFDRKGKKVLKELVSVPRMLSQGDGWKIIHLPTHVEHFYDVIRIEFDHQAEWQAQGSPLVMNLVEGGPVDIRTPNGRQLRVNYAETVVVPAAAGHCQFVNQGGKQAKVVVAFLKADWFTGPEHCWHKSGILRLNS